MAIITIRNYGDVELSKRGKLSIKKVRSITIEALVDTGATTLIMPAKMAKMLGLRERDRTRLTYANGKSVPVSRVGGVEIEILGRTATIDAIAQPEGDVVLIGQIPLESLDLVVDPKSREVRVNPKSPDAPMFEAMSA